VRLNECGLPNPSFSIVIPTMNLEGWRVKNCLWSIRQQTEQNIQVIISDVNSDKTHLEELSRLARGFDCTFIHHERPIWSIAFAYNAGLRECVGKCAATIDADVIFERKAIADTIALMGERGDKAVIRQPIFLGDGGDYSSLKFPEAYEWLSTQPEKYISPSVGSFFCAPLKWWNMVHGYDERFEMYALEDWEIWRRASRSRLRKILVGGKFKSHPFENPRVGCKLYHQPHPPFMNRVGIDETTFNSFKARNKEIYNGDPSTIVRNTERWGIG